MIDWGGVYWQKRKSVAQVPTQLAQGFWVQPLLPVPLSSEATTELARLKQPAEAQRRVAQAPVAEGIPSTAGAYPLRLGDTVTEVPFTLRGRVDQEILAEVWEGDVYGVRDLAEPPPTVLDIGAHIGAFTLLAART